MTILGALGQRLLRNPYYVYSVMRRFRPVLHDRRHNVWLLFDYESVKRALYDHAAFSSAVKPPGGGSTPDWLIFRVNAGACLRVRNGLLGRQERRRHLQCKHQRVCCQHQLPISDVFVSVFWGNSGWRSVDFAIAAWWHGDDLELNRQWRVHVLA